MTEEYASAAEPLSIAETERLSGLPRDTLRAWERRYGFPIPQRDRAGRRVYPADQVARLQRLQRLVLAGQRPARLMGLSPQELDARLALLGGARAPAAAPGPTGLALSLDGVLACLRQGGAEALGPWLEAGLARLGLRAFVLDGVAPLNEQIGRAWADGELRVYEEHLYTEAVTRVLRAALAALPLPGPGPAGEPPPRVLLTTLPGETHLLGLLMVEALLALDGAVCLCLGAQTPVPDIAAAVRTQGIGGVGLSFAGALAPEAVTQGLQQLRQALTVPVAIWAGGRGVAALGPLPGVRLGLRLDALGAALHDITSAQ